MEYTVSEKKRVALCNCKHSGRGTRLRRKPPQSRLKSDGSWPARETLLKVA